jgi:type I restriction-modification system DNA methylase subunit
MTAPREVLELVERFGRNRSAYCSSNYNETRLRIEFIDPFFKALGWDMSNERSYAEAYKDVIHEDAVKVGGTTKAPDYCFRIGGTRKFFLETKRPSVNIKEDMDAAFQLRRYAWSAKLPLSILTDFEEFAVYDCRIKPDKADKASTARVLYFTYDRFPERWDEVAAVFSREAVLKGFFDTYAESTRTKKGTAEVDAVFLAEIERWREVLARNLALRNPGLTARELNFAVQMTIDRIIFLRICEDRGIEPYKRLLELQGGGHIYEELCQLFHEADAKYNSGLFHFTQEKDSSEAPDTFTLTLKIDDKPLKEIIRDLYYPDSPYEFSVLPADILGQVYEQFLGKVIRLTQGHRAVVEEKPEVKKAGGVYYTPTQIVDYIVAHTVGKLLTGKTPRQAAKLRVLDPACGSGSFLLGAYQYLLDWHRDYYLADGPEKHRKELYEGAGGEWRLTTAERKRILLNTIYGVDLDPQAVEVTKLSLLLKVLEGESEESLATQLRLFHERVLPNLGNNIKCGNSLVGPDFYDNEQMSFLDEEVRYGINTFDWQAEYPEIMRGGGFDAVIGNPPYIFGEYHNQKAKHYFRTHFPLARDQYDTYWLFIEQGLKLTKSHGRFALIVPDALLARDETRNARAMLLSEGLESIYHCGTVFKANVSTVVFVAAKGEQPSTILSEIPGDRIVVTEHTCSRERFVADPLHRLLVHASDQEAAILSRVESECRRLDSVASLSRGEEIGKKEVLAQGPIPILVGDDIDRYHIDQPSRFVQKTTKDAALYQAPKIVIVKTGDRCIAALDTVGFVTMQSVYNLHVSCPDLAHEALLGLLNSRFVRCYIYKTFTAYKHLFPQLNQTTVLSIPVPVDMPQQQAQLVQLVRHMLSLHEKLATVYTAHDKTVLQRQIEIADRQIDLLICKLYGLTGEEMKQLEQGVS